MIFFIYLMILIYGMYFLIFLELNLIIVFLFYNINLKRYFIEGFDIFIIKNMCNGVFV